MPPRRHHIFPSWANINVTPTQNPPFWQPSVATDAHNVAQGGNLSIASYASSNPGPLSFSLSPVSTILTGTGVSLSALGVFSATISATVATITGLIVRATDVSTNLFTDSPVFSLTVLDTPPVWTGPPPTGNNITQGLTYGISGFQTSGNPPITFSISPVSTVQEGALNAGGITFNHASGVFTASSSAQIIDYPNLIVRATDANGGFSDSFPFLLHVVAASQPWTVYRNYQLINGQITANPSSGTPQILGPFATFALAKQSTIDSATNPDIVAVIPGSYAEALGLDRNLIVICAVNGTGTTATNGTTGWDSTTMATVGVGLGSGAGDSNMTPLSNKSVWLEGIRVSSKKSTQCDGAQVGSSFCVGMVIQNTQNFTMNKGMFEECASGFVTSGPIGNVTLIDTEFKNCGSTATSPNQHSAYFAYQVSGGAPVNPNQSVTLRGCRFWYSDDWCSYNTGEEWRVGIAHYLKCDIGVLTIDACYFKTSTSTGGGSTTCKIQGDSGGLWKVRGCILEEGLFSAYNPTDTAHGIAPYTSGGFQKCPTSAVTYRTTDNKIIDYSMYRPQADGGESGIFTVIAPINELHILQCTIINNGQSSEQVVAYQSFGRWGRLPDVLEVKNNVIVRNSGLHDIDTTGTVTGGTQPNAYNPGATYSLPPVWSTDGSNTIASNNSIFVNSSQENFQLVTPISGSGPGAPYEFVFPIGHKDRTDSLMGAVSSSAAVPLWLQGQPKSTWINVTKMPGLGATDAAIFHTTYPVAPNGVDGLPDLDPNRISGGFNYPVGSGYNNQAGFFGLIGSYCTWGVRKNGSWLIYGPNGGGGTHGMANEIVGVSLEADVPIYQTLLRSTTWANMASQYANPSANSIYKTPLPTGTVSSSTIRNHAVGQGTLVTPATPNGNVYSCTFPGTTGASEPNWPVSYRAQVVDGGVTWSQIAPNPQAYNDAAPLPVQTGILAGFVDNIDMLFSPAGVVLGETGGGIQTTWVFGSSTWDQIRTAADGTNYGSRIPYPEIIAAGAPPLSFGDRGVCIDQTTGTVYISNIAGAYYKWVPSNVIDNRGTFTATGISLGSGVGGANAQCFDTKRKHHIFFGKSAIAPPVRTVALKAVRVDWSSGSPVLSTMTINSPDGSLAAVSSTDPTNGNNLPGCYTCLVYVPDLPGGGGDYYLFLAGVARGPSNQMPLAQTVAGTITMVAKIIPQSDGTYVMQYYNISNSLSQAPYPSGVQPTGGDTTFDWNRIAYLNVKGTPFIAYQADKGNVGDGLVKDFDIHGFIPE